MSGTSAFPSGFDSFVDPEGEKVLGDPTQLHSLQHSLANDALTSLEERLGILGSTDTSSLDYQARNLAALAFFLGS